MASRGPYSRRQRDAWEPGDRQRQVLDLLVEGKTNAEIAEVLGITADGAKWHISEMLSASGLEDRQALARWWLELRERRQGNWILIPPNFVGLLRKRRVEVSAVAVCAGIAAAVIFGLIMQAPSSRGTGQDGFPLGLDVGEIEPASAPSGTALAAVPTPTPDRKPFFMERQLDYDGLATVRVSGGGLPHPVTIPYVEFANARNTIAGVAGANDYSWFRSAGQGASWETKPVQQPDAGLTHYTLETVHLGADRDVDDEQYAFVLGEPALAGPVGTRDWMEVFQPVAELIERYVRLGEAGLLLKEPTLAEGLAASARYFGVKASIASGAGGTRELSQGESLELLTLLGTAEPAIVAMQGNLIGQRGYDRVRVEFHIGPQVLSIYYIPPGGVASHGVLMSQRFLDAWGYVTAVAPPGYFQTAHTVAPAFDSVMAELGYPGRPLEPTVNAWTESPSPSRWRIIDRIEIWRGGGDQRLTLPPLESQPCLRGCELEVATVPSEGRPLKVAIWPTGMRPFPESVQPALYDYYPDDGSGRGVLVETAGPGIRSATYATVPTPFYPPPPLDVLLQQAAQSLR